MDGWSDRGMYGQIEVCIGRWIDRQTYWAERLLHV
jgi:hypothetical protein